MEAYESIFFELDLGGASAVEALVQQAEPEDLYLDYKRSMTPADARSLEPADKDNLAKAISGFGNGSGGIIVWGVDCREQGPDAFDVPQHVVPVAHASQFKSLLEKNTPQITVPTHPLVKHYAYPISGQTSGYVVSVIPPAPNIPLLARGRKEGIHMRAGGSFLPVPYEVMAGMFGRRPRPKLLPKVTVSSIKSSVDLEEIKIVLAISITNVGHTSAPDFHGTIKPANEMPPEYRVTHNSDHIDMSRYQDERYIFSKASFPRVIPGQTTAICELVLSYMALTIATQAAFADTEMEILFGCESSPSVAVRITLRGPDIRAAAVAILDAKVDRNDRQSLERVWAVQLSDRMLSFSNT